MISKIVAQVFEKGVAMETSSLATEYVRLQDEMNMLHDGRRLRGTAALLLEQLPPGSLALFATTDQGAGLAAACAALREEETVWQRIHLGYPPEIPDGYAVVVVEAVAGGAAWTDAVRAVYPLAQVIAVTPLGSPVQLAA
jgi:hypothetical protein